MSSNNSQLKLIIVFSIIYSIGLLILLFWGEYYFYYILGNVLSIIGFFYFVNYLMKNEVRNKHFTSIFFICLIFFWLRIPFVFKSTMLTPDYDIYYRTAKQFLNGQIKFYHHGSAYGPVYYAFLFTIALLTGGDYYAIKFSFVFLDALNIIMIYLVTNHLKIKDNHKICLLYALVPVSIIEFAWNGHNDTGMILLILISIYLFLKHKDMLAGIFVFIGILYKFYSMLVLPIFLIYYYKKSDSISHFFKRLIVIYFPVLIALGGILLYNPGMIIDILVIIRGHSRRLPVLGLLSTLNNSSNIKGIAGLIISFLSYVPDAVPSLIFFVQDISVFADYLEISWLLLGILLFIAFKDEIKKPLFFLLCLSPIILFFSKIFLKFELFYGTQIMFNLIMLILFIGIFYYQLIKSDDFNREDSITPIFYSFYIFLSIYWVNYPWYYLWLSPLLLLYAFKIKEGRFLIMLIFLNSFVVSIFWFRGVVYVEIIFILLIGILIANIILFWKILEYKDSFKEEKSEIFEKVNNKLSQFLKFNMFELYEETKQYKWILFIIFLISISNMILLTVQILILTPIIPNIDIINSYFVNYAFQSAILK